MNEFIVEEYLESLSSLRGYKLVGVGSSKLAFDNDDTVITIPYTTDGIMEMDSQYDNYLQSKDEYYSRYLNPVIEYDKYKMISPKLIVDIEDDLSEDFIDSYILDTIPIDEAFSQYNIGMDNQGCIKSFDYGNYNEGESVCCDLLEGMDNVYFNMLIGSTDVAHIIARELVKQYNLHITLTKDNKLFTQSMLVEDEYIQLNIRWGSLVVGDCELYLYGDDLRITSFYILPRFRRFGLGSLAVQYIVSMGYTITGDAVPDAYKFWEAQEVQFDDYHGEFDPLSTYEFVI